MNPHILFVIDHQLNPDKYTIKQLIKNSDNANSVGPDSVCEGGCRSDIDAANAAWSCLVHYPAHDNFYIEHSIKEYFENTGENIQDYIDAINKDNKQ